METNSNSLKMNRLRIRSSFQPNASRTGVWSAIFMGRDRVRRAAHSNEIGSVRKSAGRTFDEPEKLNGDSDDDGRSIGRGSFEEAGQLPTAPTVTTKRRALTTALFLSFTEG